jgi:pimeloyl-ACP methyl ester carboxylesterase
MYSIQTPSRSEFVPIRNWNYHVLQWGEPSSDFVPIVMVHGWMDVAASFQFMVDALQSTPLKGRHILAPDWRGYGQTTGPVTDNFWMPDYLADLDFLLDHYFPAQAIDLVGHSMGGNVAMMYAGIRPERVRRLVNLEGFGMPATNPEQAPGRYAKWMEELKTYHRGELDLKAYDSADGVARRLMKTNPRLSADKANWLALHWAAEQMSGPDAGKWKILGEAAHKIINANLYQVPEALAIYRSIQAPTLAIQAAGDSLTQWWKGRYTIDEYHERLNHVPQVRRAEIQDAGHMLHHDQPEAIAALLADFLV